MAVSLHKTTIFFPQNPTLFFSFFSLVPFSNHPVFKLFIGFVSAALVA